MIHKWKNWLKKNRKPFSVLFYGFKFNMSAVKSCISVMKSAFLHFSMRENHFSVQKIEKNAEA